jgi:hypothetical protein
MKQKDLDLLNDVIKREIYPRLIEDFFIEGPFIAFLRSKGFSQFAGGKFAPTIGMRIDELDLEIDEELMKEYEEYLKAEEG